MPTTRTPSTTTSMLDLVQRQRYGRRVIAQPKRRYTPPVKYTQEELDRFLLEDLAVDLVCARRDGIKDYEREVERALRTGIANYATTYGSEPVFGRDDLKDFVL